MIHNTIKYSFFYKLVLLNLQFLQWFQPDGMCRATRWCAVSVFEACRKKIYLPFYKSVYSNLFYHVQSVTTVEIINGDEIRLAVL